MTPINEVPVGKFCRFDGSVVYMCKNNFKNMYTLIPINCLVPQDKNWDHKVYIYKRIREEWIKEAKGWLLHMVNDKRMDNLTYIENLAILKEYEY